MPNGEGRIYKYRNRGSGEIVEFRSAVKPDKAMVKRIAAEQRAHREAAERGKVEAAQAGREAEKEYLEAQGVGDFTKDYPRLTSALIGTKELGTGIAEGAVGLAQLPAIVGEELVRDVIQPRKQLELYKGFFRQPFSEQTEAIPFVPDVKTFISPSEEAKEESPYPRLRTAGRLGGMLALGAGVGGVLRGPKAAETPKVSAPEVKAPTEVPAEVPSEIPMTLEGITAEAAARKAAVPEVAAPATFAAEVAAAKVKAGLVKQVNAQMKGIPKKEQTAIISRQVGREVKSLNELAETELRALLPEEAVPEVASEIAPKATLEVEAPRQYGPDRVAQMQAQEADFLAGRPKPLITPPPETALAVRRPTALARPEPILVEDVPRIEPPKPVQRWSAEPTLEVTEPDLSLYGRGELVDTTIPTEFKPPYAQLPPELGRLTTEKPLRRPVPAKATEPVLPTKAPTPKPAKLPQQKAAPPQRISPGARIREQEGVWDDIARGLKEEARKGREPKGPLSDLKDVDLKTLHEIEPTNTTLAEMQARGLAPKTTKLPPGPVPEEPLEFGKPLEGRRAKVTVSPEPLAGEITPESLWKRWSPREREAFLEPRNFNLGHVNTPFENLGPKVVRALTEEASFRDAKRLPRKKSALRELHEKEEGFLDVSELIKRARSKDPETGALKWHREQPYRHFARDYITTSMATAIRKYGGAQGEQMARMFKEVRTLEGNIGGALVDSAFTAAEGLSKAEFSSMAEYLGTARKSKPLNQRVVSAANRVAAQNVSVGAGAKAVELTLKRKGKKIPFEMRDPDGFYWPYEYTKEFWNWIHKEPKTRETIIRDIMSENKSRFEAEELLRMGRKFGEKRVSAQYSRELEPLAEKYRAETGKPAFSLDPDVLTRNYKEMADRIAKARVLGPEDIADLESPLHKVLTEAGVTGKDAQLLYNYLARILKRDAPPETYKYEVASGISNAMVATYLQAFPISNLAQIPMIGVYAPVRPFVTGMFGAFFKYKKASKNALLSGSSLEAHTLVHELGIGKTINKYYLLQKSEIFNRTIADSVGRATATYWFDILKKNPGNKKIASKLSDLTLIPAEQLVKYNVLPEMALRRAGYNMARISQGTVYAEDLPYAWTNSPMSKLFFIFQRYAFSTTKNMWEAIKKDPVTAPIKMLTLLSAAGEVIGDMKKFISDGTEGVERRGEWLGIENKFVARMLDNLLQGWALGMVADAFAGLWVRGEVNRSVPFEVIDTIGRNVNRIIHGKFEPVGQELLRRAPITFGVGKRIQKELLPTRRQKGKKKGGAFKGFKKQSFNVMPPVAPDYSVEAPV
jgi:hypothetical protein